LAYSAAGATINNNGDMPANVTIIYDLSTIASTFDITLEDEAYTQIGLLSFENVAPLNENDKYICVDTRT